MSIKIIKRVFDKMLGEVCWEIFHENINLSLKFGRPKLFIYENKKNPTLDRKLRCLTGIKFEWLFWVTNGYWKLTVLDNSGKKKLVATSSSPRSKKDDTIRYFWGQKLDRVEIDSKLFQTRLFFDLGAELVVRRPRDITKEVWILYEPNGYCLSLFGNGKYLHMPAKSTDRRPPAEKIIDGDIVVVR